MVYAYVNLVVTNPDQLAAYRETAGQALAKHQGGVVASSPSQTVLEGGCEDLGAGVLLQFASAEDAKAWISDPALAEVHGLRNAAGRSTITLLG